MVNVDIEAENVTGGTLERLAELTELRRQYLKNETTTNAVTATAINVLTSLRASTKTAPQTANANMYTIEELGVAGWRGGRGNRRRVPVVGGHRVSGVYPVNLMYGLQGDGKYFRININDTDIQPGNVSKNSPVYLVLAPTLAVAKSYAEARISRALQKESGLAKYALGIAAAKTSNRAAAPGALQSARAQSVGASAALVSKSGSDGQYEISVTDALTYAAAAAGGDGALENAMQKAANRTAGIINALAKYKLDEQIPTPFPEIAK